MKKTPSITNLSKNDIKYSLAYNYAQIRLEKFLSKSDGFEWIKKDILFNTYSDLFFIYKNNLFSVLLDIKDENNNSLLSAEKIEAQLSESKKHGFTACKFPLVLKKSGTPKALSDDWNLFYTESNLPVKQDLIKKEKSVLFNSLLAELKAFDYIKEYLTEKKYKIISFQNLTQSEPNFLFEDEFGKLSCMIIQLNDKTNNKIISLADKNIVLSKYGANNLYNALLHVDTNKEKIIIKPDSIEQIVNDEINTIINVGEIEQENVYNLILSSIISENISDKNVISIFTIPNYENLLLKMHNVLVENIELLAENLKLIPFDFSEDLKNNSHFGLPLYYITSTDSEYSKLDKVDPKNTIIFNETNTVILKRVSGKSVMAPYFDYFINMFNGKDSEIQAELKKILDINHNYGLKGAETALCYLENGDYKIPQNKLGRGSLEYKFCENSGFYDLYNKFKEKYSETIQNLSELVQGAYDKAIENIVLKKNFAFDFINPNNTLVDYDKQEFNFIDFFYDEKIVNDLSVELQIEYFKKVLFGFNRKKTYSPVQLIFIESDIRKLYNYEKVINDKIQKAVGKYLR